MSNKNEKVEALAKHLDIDLEDPRNECISFSLADYISGNNDKHGDIACLLGSVLCVVADDELKGKEVINGTTYYVYKS